MCFNCLFRCKKGQKVSFSKAHKHIHTHTHQLLGFFSVLMFVLEKEEKKEEARRTLDFPVVCVCVS